MKKFHAHRPTLTDRITDKITNDRSTVVRLANFALGVCVGIVLGMYILRFVFG